MRGLGLILNRNTGRKFIQPESLKDPEMERSVSELALLEALGQAAAKLGHDSAFRFFRDNVISVRSVATFLEHLVISQGTLGSVKDTSHIRKCEGCQQLLAEAFGKLTDVLTGHDKEADSICMPALQEIDISNLDNLPLHLKLMLKAHIEAVRWSRLTSQADNVLLIARALEKVPEKSRPVRLREIIQRMSDLDEEPTAQQMADLCGPAKGPSGGIN